MLGLRDRQAVAGYDDDLVGVGHLDRGIGGRSRLDGLSPYRAATATPPPPNPPATIAGMERFIAMAIRLVRIDPDAPTIMPATIIAVLFSANPAAAADNPVIALSIEMTTGMSAPPMGNTTINPSMPAAASRPIIHHSGAPPLPGSRMQTDHTAAATAATSSTMFSGCWPAHRRSVAGQDFLQLAERDDRSPERHRPDDRREQRRHHDVHRWRLAG